MDPIADIFRTMHVTAFGLHRLEAAAPWGAKREKQTDDGSTGSNKAPIPSDLAHFALVSRGDCFLSVEGTSRPFALGEGDCFLISHQTSIIMRDTARTTPQWTLHELARRAQNNIVQLGGDGAPSTIVCGSISFDRASLKPITQLLPKFILIKAQQAQETALHATMQALTLEISQQMSGSEIVRNRLAEALFIQMLRAHIQSETSRGKGWLRAIFDPQIGAAISAIHDNVSEPWTVSSLAESAGMSRSAFAARFKYLLGQTPLEYVTDWRMQRAMHLLQDRHRKLIDVAQAVGYESHAAFSKAFKRVVGRNASEYLRDRS